MASKANIGLSATLETCKTLTRRALFRAAATIGALVTLAPAAALALPADAPTPGVPQPSDTGRALLAALHDRQRIWQAAAEDPDSELNEPPYAAPLDAVFARIDELIEQIKARPITSLSDMLDYAIAASDGCHVSMSGEVETHDGSDILRDMVVAALATGGLDLHAWLETTDHDA